MADLVQGQAIVVDVEYRVEGVLRDPTNVSCLVRSPNGTVTTYVYPSTEVRRLDVGQYEVAVVTNAPGTWAFRAVGSGVVDAVQETSVNVRASSVI